MAALPCVDSRWQHLPRLSLSGTRSRGGCLQGESEGSAPPCRLGCSPAGGEGAFPPCSQLAHSLNTYKPRSQVTFKFGEGGVVCLLSGFAPTQWGHSRGAPKAALLSALPSPAEPHDHKACVRGVHGHLGTRRGKGRGFLPPARCRGTGRPAATPGATPPAPAALAPLLFLSIHTHSLRSTLTGASLVAQWLRVCLPMQGTRVRALVWDDPTCRGATGPVSHNY